MPKLTLVIALMSALLACGTSHAAIILAEYDMESQNGTTSDPSLTVPASSAPVLNAMVSEITNAGNLGGGGPADNVAPFWLTTNFSGDLPDFVLSGSPGSSASSNVNTAFNNDSYFFFTVEADSGFTLDLDELTFDVARGFTSGTRNWALRSSLTGTTNLASNTTNNATFLDAASGGSFDEIVVDLSSNAAFQDISGPVAFQFIIATDATFRTMVWDDITLTGDVVPEPASAGLLGLASITLFGRRRSRAA